MDYDDIDAELAEIDENLIRADLTAMERGEHMQRRKELHEARHPETRHGGAPGKPGGGKQAKVADSATFAPSFVTDAAAKTGRAERTVREDVQIAAGIAQDVRDAIRDTPLADRKDDLLTVSSLAVHRGYTHVS